MSNTLKLIRYEWISYWRRLRRTRSVSAANQGILLLLLALVMLKYFQLLRVASHDITEGKAALLNSLLIAILFVWLFAVASGTRAGLSTRLLLHLPLSAVELFSARLMSLLISPAAWLIVVASFAICYPLAFSPHPVAGVIAAVLFIVAAYQIGFAVVLMLSFSIWRKVLAFLGLGMLLAAAVYFSKGFAADLNFLGRFTPASLVINAALGRQPLLSIAALSFLTAAAALIAFCSFRASLGTVNTRPQRKRLFGLLQLPGRLGGLIAKDLRYFPRLLDTYFGVLTALLCCFHLVYAETPSADVVRIFVVVLFLANSALAFNLFGLDDSNGLDRYSLLPLTGRSTLLVKNLAFAILVAAQLAPLLVLTLYRLGAGETLGVMVQAAALASAYLAWGNWMSVTHPQKLSFYRFSSSGLALADVIGGLIFGSLPGVVAIYGLRRVEFPWIVLLVTLTSLGIYILSVAQFGKRFEQRREFIGAALR
ncbi:MAG: hypothetical protein WAL47_06530 [Pyrinomonadaceae bacterium]